MASNLWLDDFVTGIRIEAGSATVTEQEIVEFAGKFDPQYYHVDPVAAEKSAFGGLIGSGFHTLSLSFRLFFNLDLWSEAIIASPGMDNLKWLHPMRPGDTIRVAVEVIEVRPSRSKPDRGLVIMRHETWNQDDILILSVDCKHMLRRRT